MVEEKFDPRSPKLVFEKYIADFQKIGIDWNENWKDWTSKNLGYFARLGKSLKYDVNWKHPPDKSEYLVDLCWYVYSEQYGWMELALEEEWSDDRDAMLDDFWKLMDVKAYLKVFICFPREDMRSDMPSILARVVSIHRIKIPEEQYLLIMFSRDKRRKQAERLQIEGWSIDYRGNIALLGQKFFPDSLISRV